MSFAKQLIEEDKVVAIIGPSTSGESMAVKKIAEDGKTLLLDPEDKEEYDHWYEVVSPTELRMLDREGKPIDSKLDYSLRRK